MGCVARAYSAELGSLDPHNRWYHDCPILLVTPLPVGPIWATDTIAFFLGGIGYTVVGVTLIVTRKHAVESTVDASVKVVAQAK